MRYTFDRSTAYSLLLVPLFCSKAAVSEAAEFTGIHANGMASNYIRDGGLTLTRAIPFIQNGVLAFGTDLDSLVSQEGIGRHADHDGCGKRHDSHKGIRGRIRKPTLLERVLVNVL